MNSTSAWLGIATGLIAIGIGLVAPPEWIGYSFIVVGVLLAAIAVLGRWFKIARREGDS